MNITFYVYGKRNNKAEEYKVTAPVLEIWAKNPQGRQEIIRKLREQAPFENALIFSQQQADMVATVNAGISEF